MGFSLLPSLGRRSWRVPSRGIRQAAMLFLVAATVGLCSDFAPGGVGYHHPASTAVDLANAAIGVGTWLLSGNRVLWGRLCLILPVAAMTNVAVSNVTGVLPAPSLGIWFVLILVWVGMWCPRGTASLLAPATAAAYLAPLYLGAPRTAMDVASVFLVVPVAVMAGEVVATSTAALRRATDAQAAMLSELARDSQTDPLTGLGNRRFGELLLDSLAPGDTVAVLDLDSFKAVNDTLGHPAGDNVLRQFGDHLRSNVRGADAVARFGGEEFLVVLRRTEDGAREVIERIHDRWRATGPVTTFSAGIAQHRAGATAASTYAAADRALYAAKLAGRNAVRTDAEPSHPLIPLPRVDVDRWRPVAAAADGERRP